MPYTYSTLISDIQANMEEDSAEFVSALPAIVERAQSHLQRRLDPVNIITFTEVSVSASTRTLTLPSNLLVLKSIQVCATGCSNKTTSSLPPTGQTTHLVRPPNTMRPKTMPQSSWRRPRLPTPRR